MVEKFELEKIEMGNYGTGQVPDKRYNSNFQEQGMFCPYEHCFGLMPHLEKEKNIARNLGYFGKIVYSDGTKSINKDDEVMIIPCSPDESGAIPDHLKIIFEKGFCDDTCRVCGNTCPGGVGQVFRCNLEGKFKEPGIRFHNIFPKKESYSNKKPDFPEYEIDIEKKM
jgi:hypothetical protein